LDQQNERIYKEESYGIMKSANELSRHDGGGKKGTVRKDSVIKRLESGGHNRTTVSKNRGDG